LRRAFAAYCVRSNGGFDGFVSIPRANASRRPERVLARDGRMWHQNEQSRRMPRRQRDMRLRREPYVRPRSVLSFRPLRQPRCDRRLRGFGRSHRRRRGGRGGRWDRRCLRDRRRFGRKLRTGRFFVRKYVDRSEQLRILRSRVRGRSAGLSGARLLHQLDVRCFARPLHRRNHELRQLRRLLRQHRRVVCLRMRWRSVARVQRLHRRLRDQGVRRVELFLVLRAVALDVWNPQKGPVLLQRHPLSARASGISFSVRSQGRTRLRDRPNPFHRQAGRHRRGDHGLLHYPGAQARLRPGRKDTSAR
jgi:hypothetical protein